VFTFLELTSTLFFFLQASVYQRVVRYDDGEQKPKIVRVMQDGQEQEYIITAAPGHHGDTLEVGEEVLPGYTTLTAEQMQGVLPQVSHLFLLLFQC
jgi:hypothetical protein